jgi:hypothetical protein
MRRAKLFVVSVVASLALAAAMPALRTQAPAAGAERLRILRAEMPADSRVVNLAPQTNGTVVV